MFEYLTGAIVDTAPTYIVIDVNGVGYRLACANPFRWQVNPSDKVKVYIKPLERMRLLCMALSVQKKSSFLCS